MKSLSRPRGPRGRFVRLEKKAEPLNTTGIIQAILTLMLVAAVAVALARCHIVHSHTQVLAPAELARDFSPSLE